MKKRKFFIKENDSYSNLEILLLALFGPLVIIFLNDFTVFYSGKGYKKKNIQGILAFILGIAIWWIILLFVF